MKPMIFIVLISGLTILTGCDKVGAGGAMNQLIGNWAEVNIPEGCIVKQISAEESGGVAILCEDGRVFH